MALVGIYMALSGLLKLREGWQVSAAAIGAYKLVGATPAKALGLVLAPIEIASGVLLATGLAPMPAGIVVIGLLVLYGVAMASALRRGLSTSCGCHGSLSEKEVSPGLIVRNTVLALLVAAALVEVGPAHTVQSSPWWGAAGIVVAAGLVAVNAAISRGHGGLEQQEHKGSEVHVAIQ